MLTAKGVRDIGERELHGYRLTVQEVASGIIPRAFSLDGSSPVIQSQLVQPHLPASFIPASYDQRNLNAFFRDGSAQLNATDAVSMFLGLNRSFISKVSYLTTRSQNVKIVFCGGADGRPVKDDRFYRYDSLFLRNVVINEVYHDHYAIQHRDPITNEMIAVLRAHAIRVAYEQSVAPLNDKDVFYNARTHSQEGTSYRYGRMDYNITNVFRDI